MSAHEEQDALQGSAISDGAPMSLDSSPASEVVAPMEGEGFELPHPLAGSESEIGESEIGEPEIGESTAFAVRVTGFEGPFDLLLSLIAKKKLEVTALALHAVTDDFIQHVKAQGDMWDLDETTEFIVVASILLDLKAARLLPGESEEDAEDIALLEARDLLFARLLQYRAFKEASEDFERRLNAIPPRTPRGVGLDPDLVNLLPDVVLDLTPDRFAQIAVEALTPKPVPTVGTSHIHAPMVSVRDQVSAMSAFLRVQGQATFTELIATCPDTQHVIARFLGLLEMYRQRAILFEQEGPLADLTVRWTGRDLDEVQISGEFDEDPAEGQAESPDPAGTLQSAGTTQELS